MEGGGWRVEGGGWRVEGFGPVVGGDAAVGRGGDEEAARVGRRLRGVLVVVVRGSGGHVLGHDIARLQSFGVESSGIVWGAKFGWFGVWNSGGGAIRDVLL